jgi:exonuclease VII small subunit
MKQFIFELEESLNQLQRGMEHFPKVNDDDDENTLPWF